MIVHVEDKILAHDGQPDETDICLRHPSSSLCRFGR
jgi:hypothetical protein